MAQTVIGMFESSSKAQDAVQELVEAGIARDRIDISGGGSSSGSSYSSTGSNDVSEGSSSGSSYSSTGSTGTYGNSDEHESGISKFFKSLFGGDDDNDEADKYSRVASKAQSIVTVHAQSRDEAEKVADILDDNGAVDVDEHASNMGYSGKGNYSGTGSSDIGAGTGVTGMSADLTGAGLAGSTLAGDSDYTGAGVAGSTVSGDSDYSGTNRTGVGNTGGTDYTDITANTGTTGYTGSDVTDDETKKIQIIEENLQVGKREVKTGGVRLRSRIIERPVEESLRLREERVSVERNTVDRPATAADLANFQERDIELVERAEVPVVNKEARVVEEVSLGKEVEERTETIQDTVRKTEVDVENLSDNDLTGNNRTGNNNL